ncbi:MAG: tryptophan--tRNA ligase, partial [Candidatus Woesearchaeota archaeon]|nr:tryptophan--tRNA ligase [Candidatus Woesearchaeota archaeon]
VEDDVELQRIYTEYKSGRMLSGELKQLGCELIIEFMTDFTKKLEKARKQVGKLNFVKFG